MSSTSSLVQRYTCQERANHWLVAVTFILLTLSGMALFHPAFFFLTSLFGGGTWSRILHPFIGVVMFVSFLGMAEKFWRHNIITDADRKWQQKFGDIIRNRAHDLPEIGKYNIGQKYLFWTLVVSLTLLFVTGFAIWQPYFAPAVPIGIVRLAVLGHALLAFIAMLAIIVHIYAAYWTRGSIRAMTRGTVTAAWAKHHHPAWYREASKGAKQ